MAEKKTGSTSARRTALVALATQLGGRALAAEVILAADDPDRYLRDFRSRMRAIGVSAPKPDLSWLAITEGLKARKGAVEFDWKEEPGSILAGLRRLAGPARAKVLAPVARAIAEEVRSTEEVLELFGKALAAADVALVQLDKRSDSYVMTLRSPAEARAMPALVKRAGGGMRWFRGEAKVLAALAKATRRALAKAEADEAKESSDNPWTRLVYSTWEKSAQGVLWTLRLKPFPVEEIREAMPFAPARVQPLVAMVLALHDRPASEVARTSDDPALCAKALQFLGQERRFGFERLRAAAIVAERLGIPPKRGRLALAIVEACNLFGDPAANDRYVNKLPAEARRRLALIAEDILARFDLGDERDDALRALEAVGDESSLPALEASRAKIPRGYPAQRAIVDHAAKRIRERAAR